MVDMNLSIPELLDDYERNEHRIKEFTFDGVSENEIEILSDYDNERQLLIETGKSLEFIVASTPVIVDYNSTVIESLMSRADCLCALRTLTNDFDITFVIALYRATDMKNQYEREQTILNKLDLLLDTPGFKELMTAFTATEPITAVDLKSTTENIKALMSEYQIDETAIMDSTLIVAAEKHAKRELYKIVETTSRSYEENKDQEDLVIVESNDGYVMATNASPELFNSNPELERRYSEQVTNGNEIVHNEAPRQTTIDMSKVGGNIKYEQYDDIGTVEKENGIPTFEEKVEQEEVKERQREGSRTTKTTRITQTHRTDYMDK